VSVVLFCVLLVGGSFLLVTERAPSAAFGKVGSHLWFMACENLTDAQLLLAAPFLVAVLEVVIWMMQALWFRLVSLPLTSTSTSTSTPCTKCSSYGELLVRFGVAYTLLYGAPAETALWSSSKWGTFGVSLARELCV
jgi:hypothetical protein